MNTAPQPHQCACESSIWEHGRHRPAARTASKRQMREDKKARQREKRGEQGGRKRGTSRDGDTETGAAAERWPQTKPWGSGLACHVWRAPASVAIGLPCLCSWAAYGDTPPQSNKKDRCLGRIHVPSERASQAQRGPKHSSQPRAHRLSNSG